MKDIRADINYLLVFPVSENTSDGDTKPWTGWSMTRGEVVTGLAPPANFMVNTTESKTHPKSGKRKGSTTRARGVFPCERCGRSYVRKDSLQRHLQWECGKEPAFQCPFCPQRCKRKAHQIRHIHRRHSDMIDVVDVEVIPGITEVTNG